MTTEREFSEAEDKKAEDEFQTHKIVRRGLFIFCVIIIGAIIFMGWF